MSILSVPMSSELSSTVGVFVDQFIDSAREVLCEVLLLFFPISYIFSLKKDETTSTKIPILL